MKLRTHCRKGHAMTPQNTKVTRDGYRVCRECLRLKAAERYDRDYRATPKEATA